MGAAKMLRSSYGTMEQSGERRVSFNASAVVAALLVCALVGSVYYSRAENEADEFDIQDLHDFYHGSNGNKDTTAEDQKKFASVVAVMKKMSTKADADLQTQQLRLLPMLLQWDTHLS